MLKLNRALPAVLVAIVRLIDEPDIEGVGRLPDEVSTQHLVVDIAEAAINGRAMDEALLVQARTRELGSKVLGERYIDADRDVAAIV